MRRIRKMMRMKLIRNRIGVGALVAITLVTILGNACQPNPTIMKDVAPSPTPMSTAEVKATTFKEDLREMRDANFDFILVFRRKDGGVFDKEDRKFLRENTPPEVNRWRASDNDRAFIAGSGFVFLPEQMAALTARFEVTDYSKPDAKAAAESQLKEANSNLKKKEK